jgi:hypothetical protein
VGTGSRHTPARSYSDVIFPQHLQAGYRSPLRSTARLRSTSATLGGVLDSAPVAAACAVVPVLPNSPALPAASASPDAHHGPYALVRPVLKNVDMGDQETSAHSCLRSAFTIYVRTRRKDSAPPCSKSGPQRYLSRLWLLLLAYASAALAAALTARRQRRPPSQQPTRRADQRNDPMRHALAAVLAAPAAVAGSQQSPAWLTRPDSAATLYDTHWRQPQQQQTQHARTSSSPVRHALAAAGSSR